MILKSIRIPSLLKSLKKVLYLESQINKTYGSINKPINHFGQNTKFINNSDNINKEQKEPKDEKLEDDQYEASAEHNDEIKENPFQLKKNKEFAFFFKLNEREKFNLIEDYRQKEMIRELSIICRQMHFYHQKSDQIWTAMEEALVSFFVPPFDQEKIRYLSKFLSGLGKSKRVTRNYEQQIMDILPYSSGRSFSQLVMFMSRLGNLSQEFLQTVQNLYWKKKQQFGPLELNLINYVLARNSRKIDTSLVENLDSYPLRSIALLLKTFDKACMITPVLLKNCAKQVIQRKTQTSFFDLKHLVNIYLKYQYFDNYHLLMYFDEQYRLLSGKINQETLQQIWQYFPESVNKNKLPPTFVQDVISSLKKLRKSNKISPRGWNKLSLTFPKFMNLQIREDLQKLIKK